MAGALFIAQTPGASLSGQSETVDVQRRIAALVG
jgi:hypothetical protein